MTSTTLILFLLVNAISLGDATFEASPGTYLTKQGSYEQAQAALEAATQEIPAEVLLAMAWIESRYSSGAISRIEGGVRRTGIPLWKTPPSNTRSFFCGVTQVSAGDSWAECRRFSNVTVAYRTTVIELNRWLSPRICNHKLNCALTGYSGGFPAIKSGNRYAFTVMWRAKLIKQALRRKDISCDYDIAVSCSRSHRSSRNQVGTDGTPTP